MSLEPLTDDDERTELIGIANNAEQIAQTLSNLYNNIAPRAFGIESLPKKAGPMG